LPFFYYIITLVVPIDTHNNNNYNNNDDDDEARRRKFITRLNFNPVTTTAAPRISSYEMKKKEKNIRKQQKFCMMLAIHEMYEKPKKNLHCNVYLVSTIKLSRKEKKFRLFFFSPCSCCQRHRKTFCYNAARDKTFISFDL
jgi:hypothetical protein